MKEIQFPVRVSVFPEHSSRTDVPFQAPKEQLQLAKKMANSNNSWYTEEKLEDYYFQTIGNFFNIQHIQDNFFSTLFLRNLCQVSRGDDIQ